MDKQSGIYLKRGILWNSVSQFGLIGVQLIATISLGRILTPSDYGILGMMSIFIAIANMIVDSGMGGALVRKKDISYKDYSTLFIYNFGVSLFIYLVLFFVAPYIAAFYERIELIDAIRVLGLTIVIYAFCITQNVRVIREMRFKTLALINCSSGVISLVVAILVAIKGFGYWALIIQQIVTAFCNTLFLSIYNRFLPSLVFSKESFREQFKFGFNLLFSNLLKAISGSINSNVVAKIAPLNQVGYFFQANRLVGYYDNIYGGIIDKSVFPVFAKIEDKQKLLDNYITLERFILSLTFPVCVLMSLLSYLIIRILLGSQWEGACWMFELLVFSIMPAMVQILIRNILKSLGNTRHILNNEVVKSIIMLSFLFLGVLFSLRGIIWGLVLSQSISAVWMMRSLAKELGYGMIKQVKTVFKYVVSNLLVYVLVKSVLLFWAIENMFVYAVAIISLWIIFTLLMALVFRQRELIDLVGKLTRKIIFLKREQL